MGLVTTAAHPWLEPVTLEGETVRLEPLRQGHAEAIFAHYERRAMAYLPSGQDIETLEQFGAYIATALESRERTYWAIRLRGTGQVAGFALFAEIKPGDGWLAIGTLVMPAFWGTAVNAATKLSLMTRAFEALGVTRVQFTVDARNARSMRALEKLGATREALLRQYDCRGVPEPLDIAVYSVLDDEWPTVKKTLEAQITSATKETP